MIKHFFYPVVLQGLFVVFSYILIYRNESKYTEYFAGLTGSMFMLWAVSVAFTITSYFLLLYVFVWECKPESCSLLSMSHENTVLTLLCIYTVFLGSAAQYAGFTVNDVTRDSKSTALALNLWTTGIASLLICICAILIVGIEESWYYISIVSGVILAIHHIIFDAYYWYSTFTNGYQSMPI